MVTKTKHQPGKKHQAQQREKAKEVMAEVPAEYVFWCHDGRNFKSMKDLCEGLAVISDDIFAYHVNTEKNDFSKWVKDIINDEKLAMDLAAVTSRTSAVECVAARLATLS